MSLTAIASNIYFENGIWFSSKRNNVSYPEEGNSEFFPIEETSFWFKHRNDCIINLVHQFSKDAAFYDIGGGNGFVSIGLQHSGIETVLVEPGLQGCMNAKKRGLQNILCSTLEDAGFAPSSIDACGLFDVVEHIDDDAAFMGNIYKHLKPGGYCYITVPAYKMLWSNEDIDAGHFRRYNSNRIKSLLKTCGFDVFYSTYLFSFLVLPVFLLRSLPSLWKKPSLKFELDQKEHSSSGISKLIVKNICKMEFDRISMLKKIPFGSSVLLVAKKPV